MRPKTILVVDDTDDARELTAFILRRADFDVLEAGTGREALEVAARQPDLIVLDVHMPDMDGFEVCQRLKATPATASIPVLHVSSSYRRESDRVRGLESGGDAYLTRPLDPADLVASVNALLQTRRSGNEFSIFDRATDGVWAADEEGRITYANARLGRMLGGDPGAMLGRQFGDFVDPVERATLPAMFERQRRGLAGPYELQCWRHDGTDFWAVVSVMPLVDGSGGPRGMVGVVIDVTGRKHEAQELQRLASIVASSSDAIIGKTLDGIITSWNPAAHRMYGYTPAEAIGRSISIIVPPDRSAEIADALATLRESGQVPVIETIGRRRDGSTLDVSLTMSPIREVSGELLGVSTIARDIGDRKRAETAERDAASLRSVASLATAAAHEINNPLTVIVGALQLLQRRASDPAVYDRLQGALDAAFEIRDITLRMKHVTRLEAHPLSASPDLPEMLDLQASSDPGEP